MILYTGVYIIKIIDIFAPPPFCPKWYFSPKYNENFIFSPFLSPLTPYNCVFLNKLPYFPPKQPISNIFAPTGGGGDTWGYGKYTPLIIYVKCVKRILAYDICILSKPPSMLKRLFTVDSECHFTRDL